MLVCTRSKYDGYEDVLALPSHDRERLGFEHQLPASVAVAILPTKDGP